MGRRRRPRAQDLCGGCPQMAPMIRALCRFTTFWGQQIRSNSHMSHIPLELTCGLQHESTIRSSAVVLIPTGRTVLEHHRKAQLQLQLFCIRQDSTLAEVLQKSRAATACEEHKWFEQVDFHKVYRKDRQSLCTQPQ